MPHRARVLCALLLLAAGFGSGAPGAVSPAHADPTLVVKWNRTLMECIRRSRIGPPMVARAIGVSFTCGYDAWAEFDDVALSTRLGGSLRRPAAERTVANREQAFSYGIYRALLDLFPGQTEFVRARMAELGFDPDDASTATTTPSGMGNVCANAVITFRHGDGSNQLGDLHAGPYSDYTGYAPANDPDHINDPNRWQPLRFCDGSGGFVTPSYIGPHWGNVVPFALAAPSQFRPGPPQMWPHGGYVAQANEIIHLTAHLDDRQKVIAEYWADGPRSELPPGHWTLFAEYVSARDGHTFDQDVKLFFALGNAVMDAGIAVWDAKRHYDYARPITAIRFLKAGKQVPGYVPFQGRTVIRGEDWLPYQPCSFITPPFPEYVSGHSAFSAAGAEILKRFTGSDAFGGSVTIPALSSRVEPGYAPATDITLSWATFSEAADEAGMSRRYGGIHFQEGDLRSRLLGRQVAGVVWDRAQSFIQGTAAGPVAFAPARRPEAAPEAARPEPAPVRLGVTALGPNPTPGPTRIEFTVPRAEPVRLSIVDLVGREIARLTDGSFPPGRHAVVWDGGSGSGRVGPGMYFVVLRGGAERAVARLVVMR